MVRSANLGLIIGKSGAPGAPTESDICPILPRIQS